MFNQSIFGVSTAAPGAGSWGTDGKNPKYTTQGSEYPGGSGSLTVTGAAAGGELAAAAAFAAEELVTYKYDKYSIDGIYFLDGTLIMKTGAATGAAPSASAFEASADATLKLSEVPATGGDAKEIAEIEFKPAFKPTFTAEANKACGSVYELAGAHTVITGVTVKKAGAGGFTDLKLDQTAVGAATTYPAGAGAGLMMALVGPRWYK